jgi:murein tripeptide amidase MpaA
LSGVEVPLLTITDFKDKEIAVCKRKIVVVSARVHPGESNGSWMMEGYLKFLLSSHPDAVKIRKEFLYNYFKFNLIRILFKIVPMLNPDGVILGNYRTGVAGRDLNRVYIEPNEKLHPTIFNLKGLIHSLKNIH